MKQFYSPLKYLAITLLLLSIGIYSNAQDAKQEIILKGKILDESSGEALIGAAVIIKGTSNVSITDVDGAFELKTTKAVPFSISVSYTGYQDKDIDIYEEDQAIEIKLRSQKALSEVVVVGYGKQKRKDITGSVASIPVELKTQPVASVERLLQGAVAGAVVTQTSGQPGGGVSVQIRGNNSITAGSDPLYVIDGFPIYNSYGNNDAGATDPLSPKLNPLSFLSPSDIENIDVLKDASATAIYGSRGANGVVMVTTKKGQKNQSSVQYDGYYGVQNVIRTIPLLNGQEWWQLRKDAAANTPNAKNPVTTLPTPAGLWNYDTTGAGTNWQDLAFRQAAIQNHSLSFFSGTDKTKLALSGNYFKQDGVLINTGTDRLTGRINLEHEFNNRFKLSSYINGSQSWTKVAPAAIVPALLFSSPAIPVRDNSGNFVRNTSTDSPYQNPINSLTNQVNNSNSTRVLANVAGDYKILESLTAKVSFGADILNNKQERYLPNSTYEGNPSGGSGTGGIATLGNIQTNGWLNENTLNYNKTFNKIHRVDVVGGFTAQAYETKGFIASSGVFAFDDLGANALQNGNALRAPSSFARKETLASYLGRVNYVLNDKYLFTATLRADGSSKFGPDNKWGYFPSAAIGWNLHKEEFLKNVPLISNLKVRLSTGLTGNQDITAYSALGVVSAFRYNFGGSTVQGYAPTSVNNPGLKWEKTSQTDFGIDFGLFNNRINIIADYYYKRTSDLLLGANVSGTSGLGNYDAFSNTTQSSLVNQNIGEVENKGFELAVNTQNFVGKKFNWNTIFIFSQNSNKVLSIGGANQYQPSISLPSVLQVGAPVGSFLVYQTDGVIQPGEEGAKALTPQANKSVGGQKYKDINGDGKITQADDRVVVKNQPGLNFGFTNTFTYKTSFGEFDLTAFFQSTVGSKLYNQNRAQLELNTGFNNGNKDAANAYRAPGTRGLGDPGNTGTDVKEAYQDPAITISDRFIEDASYLRLKNLTIGYTFPEAWTSKIKVKKIRIYASAQNLATWTKYTGYDPEASTQGQILVYKGIDNGVYPNSKLVQGGVNLTF